MPIYFDKATNQFCLLVLFSRYVTRHFQAQNMHSCVRLDKLWIEYCWQIVNEVFPDLGLVWKLIQI